MQKFISIISFFLWSIFSLTAQERVEADSFKKDQFEKYFDLNKFIFKTIGKENVSVLKFKYADKEYSHCGSFGPAESEKSLTQRFMLEQFNKKKGMRADSIKVDFSDEESQKNFFFKNLSDDTFFMEYEINAQLKIVLLKTE